MRINLLSLLLFLFVIGNNNAQTKSPKLGLTLSGGGAKGLAHIGVLKVLEEEGIEPDFITGTSMGSIIGGLYAIGYTAKDLEEKTKEIPWDDYFNDNVTRNLKPIEDKDIAERYQFSFQFEDGKIQIPKGFIKGVKLQMLLSELTLPAHHIENFDDFYIPFRCVSTNLVTGEGHVFDKGFLPEAMRASAGIPTVFAPVEVDGEMLVDGMLVRNLPVQDVQEMGATHVIAVDVGAPLYEKEELTSLLAVTEQSTGFCMAESTTIQQALSDVLIVPELKKYGALDFSQVDSIIHLGEVAARRALPQIRALKKKLNLKNRSPKDRTERIQFPDTLLINSISLEEDDTRAQTTLLRLLKIQPPQTLSIQQLNDRLIQVYGSGFFSNIDYHLIPSGDGYELIVHSKKNSDVYLKAGGYYDTDINASILINATIRNLLLLGSRLTLDLRISERPAALFDYLIQTNSSRPSIGFRIDGAWDFYPGDLYENGNFVNSFEMQHAYDNLGIFSAISNHSSLWLGWGTEIFIQNQTFSTEEVESVNQAQNYLFLKYNRDKLNRKYFPTKGYQLSLNGKYLLGGQLKSRIQGVPNLNVGNDYYAQLEYDQIFSLGKKASLLWYNRGGYAEIKERNYINLFYLGRKIPYENQHVNFVGFDYMERLAQRYAFSGIRLQFEPRPNKFISLLYNYGYFELDDHDIVEDQLIYTKSAEKGVISGVGAEIGMLVRQFGPLRFRGEYNFLTKHGNAYLTIGYAF